MMNHPKNYFKSILVAFALLGAGNAVVNAQGVSTTQLKQFKLMSSTQIHAGGKQISDPAFKGDQAWFDAAVPSTVLTALVANKVYPDPHIGMNNMLIPDANDSFSTAYGLDKYSYLPHVKNPWKDPYWYRTTFNVADADPSKRFELIFDGINYRAEVWLNGHQVADSSKMVGMFAKYQFDVTPFIKANQSNALAVKIYPLDYPGTPDTEQLQALGSFYLNGGPTGDIGKNVTMLCSVGWDWMPPTRDRNMGIWQPVYLRETGVVSIGNTQLITELPKLPDTSEASLKLNLALHNSSSEAVKGKLQVSIHPENFKGNSSDRISFSQDVTVGAKGQGSVSLDANKIKDLLVKNPKLWWPVGYGDPNLYRIQLKFTSQEKTLDDTSFVFGIRTVKSEAESVGGHYDGFYRRNFYVNGKRIHLVGGAWVPDMMLDRDAKRFYTELSLCKNANLNLIRIWGGGITPPEPFWDAADRLGLLVWNDFWVTGDTQGEFKGSPDYPFQGNVFLKNVTSSILSIRNHSSLLVWTGGNEGHARKELYDGMRQAIITLDGTRPYIPSSSGYAKMPKGWLGSWPDNKPAGVYSGGPYAWKDPKVYYSLADTAKDWLFKDETGIPSQPPLNTLRKVIPDMVWDTTLPYPFNNTWGYHDACTGAGKYDEYYQDMVSRYGQPLQIDSFSNKMQLMNATGYQGIFEAANSKISDNGGVMLWKLNAALPSVIWQIYDWYLLPNAGYYYMKKACEPVHIQFNQNDSAVAVINRSRFDQGGLTAEATLYDITGKVTGKQTAKVKQALADHAITALSLKKLLQGQSEFRFILLSLKDQAGKEVSSNVYWTAAGNDYTALNQMTGTKISASVVNSDQHRGWEKMTIKLENKGQQIAFFNRGQVLVDGEEINAALWSDNYVTLAPGESKELSVTFERLQGVGRLQVKFSGWNTKEELMDFATEW
ncbi:glycoside hydrolase family 2 protein [Arachidicoccus rhizosphaerae]|nr:sugar-binding domain-containing protein [Arachidicoccus rhizosphaerae]